MRSDITQNADLERKKVSEKDAVLPQKHWEFDEEVAACFDDMLARSIPQYSVMRDAVTAAAARWRTPNTDIVDLGCSRGGALAPLIDKFGAQNRYVGIEVSEAMLEAVRERFKNWIQLGLVDIKPLDLRKQYPVVFASVTLAVLTLQFVPIEHRQRIVSDVFDTTVPGGAFVVVEKVLGQSRAMDDWMVDTYYTLKAKNGYSQEQIERKRLSLEGVLVPVTAEWNRDMLLGAGFARVECFWRWMNFAAWVAVKGK